MFLMSLSYGKWQLLQKKAFQEEAPKYTLSMTGHNGALIFVPLKNIRGLPGMIPIFLNNMMQQTHGPAALRSVILNKKWNPSASLSGSFVTAMGEFMD